MTKGNDARHLDRAEMGGDPPCWAGLVDDHRDRVGAYGPPATDAAPAASSRSSNEGYSTDRPSDDHRASQTTDRTNAGMATGGGATAAQDLSTPTQVHYVVIAFYREIMFDELLEPVFGEVAEVDWAEHIPKLIDYWCWILFGTKGYAGAVTRAHRQVHGLQPIERAHCDRWFSLWVRCVDERWSGPYAERAKTHAAVLMAGMAKRLFGFAWVAPSHASARAPAG